MIQEDKEREKRMGDNKEERGGNSGGWREEC